MEDFSILLNKQKLYYNSQITKSIDFRIKALHLLKKAIKTHENEIYVALKNDLNKGELDTFSTEIGILYEEISFTLRNLKKWSQPIKVKTSLTHFGTIGKRHPEPYGSVLIIAPWNYPFQLAISPLIGAIAAGNCIVIKPSELTPQTSSVIYKLISSVFDSEFITVIEGDVDVSTALLSLPFNYIFFTGSVGVGKVVMEAAAKHLTPFTLELGGKSPCIVHNDADLNLAAKRIAWGKFLNAGQTCIAPDYLYVHESVYSVFVDNLKSAIKDLYTNDVFNSSNFVRIVSKRHFDRLVNFLSNGVIEYGGEFDQTSLIIEPTLLSKVTWDDEVMQDEIFGPILPVLVYSNIDDVIPVIQSKPHPLALYLFSSSEKVIDKVVNEVEYGGGCINDTLYHIVTPYLPFGGKGNSGIGAYHGKSSFETFTHYKSVLRQTNWFDIPFRYPNFKNGLKVLKMLFR